MRTNLAFAMRCCALLCASSVVLAGCGDDGGAEGKTVPDAGVTNDTATIQDTGALMTSPSQMPAATSAASVMRAAKLLARSAQAPQAAIA